MGRNKVKVRQMWLGAIDDETGKDSESFVCTPSLTKSRSVTFIPRNEIRLGDLVGAEGCAKRLVWQPSSKGRVFWEVLSVIVIGWDLLTLPLSAFGLDMLEPVDIISQFTTCFWAVDMIFSFFVAYQRPDGLIEMGLKAIAKHYIRTWFLFDLAVVTVDVTLLLLFGGSLVVDGIRLGKTIRVIRLIRTLRMVRLARFMKMVYLMERVADVMISKALMAVINIFKLLVGVALVTHFIACGWYAIGTWHAPHSGWVQEFRGEPTSYLYILSFHWSMAQFTPAPNNVHPTNFEERLYALLALFLGLVLFTSLIGRVTTLLANSRRLAYEQMVQVEKLRELCVKNQVSLALGNRILRFLGNRRSDIEARVIEADVESLQRIPASMLLELRYVMYSRSLVVSPVFALMRTSHRAALSEVCYTAVKESRVPRDDELFNFGTPGTHAYFITAGEFRYTSDRLLGGMMTESASSSKGVFLGKGDSLSEVVLWTMWVHRGLLTARLPGTALMVSNEQFAAAVTRFQPCQNMLRKYVRHVVDRMFGEVVMVDDLWKPFSSEEQASFAVAEQSTRGLLESMPSVSRLGSHQPFHGGIPTSPSAERRGMPSPSSNQVRSVQV